MQKILSLKLLPSEAADKSAIKKYIAAAEAVKSASVSGYNILKQSIDARGKQTWININLVAFINEPYQQRKLLPVFFNDVSKADKEVIVIGAGPAGLFAALKLIECGIRPVIFER